MTKEAPASRAFPRAFDLLGAERFAVAFSVPAFFGAPKPMVVRQAISDGRFAVCAFGNRPCDRLGIMAIDARRGPAGGLESLHLVDQIGQRQRPVDRDAVVVEQHGELVELEMAGERDRLVTEAFHQVAVGGEHIGAMVDQLVAERAANALGDRHTDRIAEPLAERPGGGLDAGRDEVLGMAGVSEPSWRKRLISSIVDPR